jgi:hypothetical protein
MKNKILLKLLMVVFSLLLWQCRAKKPLITDSTSQELLSKQKADTIVKQVLENNFEFTDLKAKIKTKFKSREKQNIAFGTFVKIVKDSAIHATISIATIPVVVALITPDTLKFINKKEQKYFVGGIDYVKSLLKTDISFYEIQDLLVGNPVKLKPTDTHYLIEEENEVFLSSKSKNALLSLKKSNLPSSEWLVKYWVNELYKTGRTVVENDAEKTVIEIIQADYNKVDGQFFPNRTQAEIVTPKDSITIQLNYQRVKINTGVDFEFSIPDHYSSY